MSYCLNPLCGAPQNPETHRFCHSCGAELLLRGRYQAQRLLGQGGFGRTFLAIDAGRDAVRTAGKDLGRSAGIDLGMVAKSRTIAASPPGLALCVIKQFFPASPDRSTHTKASELFLQEALRLGDLGMHPQIPQLIAHFEAGAQQYLIQEYIAGETLGTLLATEGNLSPMAVQTLLAAILPVLEFIHQHQVIHRDLKPENMIRRSPTSPSPNASETAPPDWVLVDFGAAKVATATALARTGTVIGSAGFVAPEQLGGRAVFASDLYSLGVTCVHGLTGVDPFELYSFGEDGWVWRDFLPAPIDAGLGKILDQLIARPLKQRYASAAEVLADLSRLSVPEIAETGTANPGTAGGAIALPSPSFPLPDLASVDDMPSAVGVDYTPLRDYLAIAQWDKADAETCRLMLQAMRHEPNSYLSLSELAQFPSRDLRTISHLWHHYSQGHLGFAAQCQVWGAIAPCPLFPIAAWSQFCEQVGWVLRQESRVGQRVIGEASHSHWRSRDELWGCVQQCPVESLSNRVPRGFLPCFGSLYTGISRGGRIFLTHLQACGV